MYVSGIIWTYLDFCDSLQILQQTLTLLSKPWPSTATTGGTIATERRILSRPCFPAGSSPGFPLGFVSRHGLKKFEVPEVADEQPSKNIRDQP